MSPAYRSFGGDLVYAGRYRTREWFEAQADIALREHDACLRIGARRDARIARTMFLEITDALAKQARWVRCGQIRRAA